MVTVGCGGGVVVSGRRSGATRTRVLIQDDGSGYLLFFDGMFRGCVLTASVRGTAGAIVGVHVCLEEEEGPEYSKLA